MKYSLCLVSEQRQTAGGATDIRMFSLLSAFDCLPQGQRSAGTGSKVHLCFVRLWQKAVYSWKHCSTEVRHQAYARDMLCTREKV